jgi:hypothetical protein
VHTLYGQSSTFRGSRLIPSNRVISSRPAGLSWQIEPVEILSKPSAGNADRWALE